MKDMDIIRGTCDRGQTDFDLIEELIEEDEQRVAAPLPRPPPPPAELHCESGGGGHRRPLHSASPPPQPLLLPRGTACQPTHTYPELPPHSSPFPRQMARPTRGAASPLDSARCLQGAPCFPGSKSPRGAPPQSRAGDTEMLERILRKPKLVVVEEPKERGMRFRYECEGRSAGSILGASSTETNKTQPAVEIQGPVDHLKKATLTVSLVTKDPPHRPHPHCLVGKDCPEGSGICLVTINPHSNRCHSFANLGIQCVRRKELDVSLQKRRSQNIDPFQTGDSKGIEDMDMNAVRLCFQCELEWDDGRKDSLSPVVSTPIYDKKATTTSQLKISCLNQYSGSCAGKTEVYMLCDKVQKDDIEIVFRRGSWKANGEFAQTDVHRQIAIVFKTPPYQDQDIAEEVKVSVSLRRISDQMESEPIGFTYLPHNPDPYEVKRKRKIKSTCVTADSTPPAEQPFHFPDDRLHGAQPATSALGEGGYGELVDSSSSTDEAAIINHLLEIPGIWEMFSDQNLASPVPPGFEQGPDTNASFVNMDANQNFGAYTQDFAHYSDLQFNMLVNENHNQQPEAPDGLSGAAVQVKTEEEQ